ncbi:MAG: preprotein translocase subunit SecE [Firmicutes bacterium]|nr:preprotein translocase subunit SecE [Bacillota bacterium]
MQKEAERRGLFTRFREIGSELKKVQWPELPQVVKQTGVVIGVVIFFTLAIFGIDSLLVFLRSFVVYGER